MERRKTFLALAASVAIVFATAGCALMKAGNGEEYKAQVAASSDADMVGNKTCWQCHKNESHSGAGTVNCEDCHGPGILAVKDLHEEKGRMACNYKTFIPIGTLSKPQQSAICMGCHSQKATFALHNWNASAHNLAGVSCIDCHNIHHGSDLKPKRSEQAEMCFGCHEDVRAALMLPNHHPVLEGKVTCVDCHNPHGSPNPGPMLIGETVKETCTRCHAEKEGPFVFEHADLMEDCTICHMSHGSQNDWLLAERQPYLCKQCHMVSAHPTTASGFNATTLCTNCHSQIHGTDIPGFTPGDGTFIR